MPSKPPFRTNQTPNKPFARILQGLSEDLQEVADLYNDGKPQAALELYDSVKAVMDSISWTS